MRLQGYWVVGGLAAGYLPVLLASPVEMRPLIGTGTAALASGLTALLLAVAAQRTTGSDRRLHLGLAAGMACACVLNIAWVAVELGSGAPSLVVLAPLYATTYGCFVWSLAHLRQLCFKPSALLRAAVDAVIITASAGLLVAVGVAHGEVSGSALIAYLVLPAFDVLLLRLVLAAAFGGRGRRPLGPTLLVITLALVGTGDLLFAVRMAAGTFASGTAHELLWLCGWVAMTGVAATTQPDRPVGAGLRARRLTDHLTVIAFVVAMASVAVTMAVSSTARTSLMPTAALLVLCSGWRQWWTVRDGHRMLELLHIRATTDELTGLTNRSELLNVLAEDEPGTLVLVDLNGFKQVNDQLGHAAGDAVLVAVAERMRRHAGACDVVARWGGDEFIVFSPGVGASDAQQLAERLKSVLAEPLTVEAGDCAVGASVGIAERAIGGQDVAAWIARADAAMYRDKELVRLGVGRRQRSH